MILEKDFFKQGALDLAKDLLENVTEEYSKEKL